MWEFENCLLLYFSNSLALAHYPISILTMYNIRFFSKLAFICNICFLLAVIIQWMPHPMQGEMIATTVILGYVFAAIVNLMINLWYAILFFSGKLLSHSVPRWLIIANFLFLIPELMLLLKWFAKYSDTCSHSFTKKMICNFKIAQSNSLFLCTVARNL